MFSSNLRSEQGEKRRFMMGGQSTLNLLKLLPPDWEAKETSRPGGTQTDVVRERTFRQEVEVVVLSPHRASPHPCCQQKIIKTQNLG